MYIHDTKKTGRRERQGREILELAVADSELEGRLGDYDARGGAARWREAPCDVGCYDCGGACAGSPAMGSLMG